MQSFLKGLMCRACCTQVAADRPVGVCPTCGQALFAEYDLESVRAAISPRDFGERPPTLWRYFELLPVSRPERVMTLGEGMSPVLTLDEVPEAAGVRLSLKDDGQMPTGSFKARGMSVALSRATELGIDNLFVPSAGNAGVALAAYGARAKVRVRVYLPDRTDERVFASCIQYGAEVVRVPGTLTDAGRVAREREKATGGFDMSTLREPYRVEGKKTMGLELFEQLPGEAFPDVIVYPTGGGTGLVGMFKAFQELTRLGWLDRTPRLISVQPEGCAPVVRAIREGAGRVEPWDDPRTIAPGLLVPAPFASERILEAIRGSQGSALTVSDAEIVRAMRELAHRHGISASPEGAATFAALPKMVRDRIVHPDEHVVLYNTGSGLTFSILALEQSLADESSHRALEH